MFQNCDISIKAAAGDVSLRRSCYCDLELVAELFTCKCHQIGCVIKITTGRGLAKRNIAAQCQHMVYTLCQILLQLLLDAFLCIFDNGEVRYRCGACLDDLLTYLTVTSYISAACSICTGDVLRIELAEAFQSFPEDSPFPCPSSAGKLRTKEAVFLSSVLLTLLLP